MLGPLESLSLTDRVENILRVYFQESAFKPGDALPNEMEMAQKLNVSRNVVREALSRLRMLGMIEARPRKGMVMSQPDLLTGMEKVLNPFILGDENLQNIFELRLILEMGISEFLFARKTDQDIEELEAIVERQSNDFEATKEEEIAFHGKLYEMTGNDTLKRFQILLMPVFNHVFTDYYREKVHLDVPDPVTHRDLVNVIKEGTSDEFRQAIFKHLEPYFRTSLTNR